MTSISTQQYMHQRTIHRGIYNAALMKFFGLRLLHALPCPITLLDIPSCSLQQKSFPYTRSTCHKACATKLASSCNLKESRKLHMLIGVSRYYLVLRGKVHGGELDFSESNSFIDISGVQYVLINIKSSLIPTLIGRNPEADVLQWTSSHKIYSDCK